jgi:hypothetical protein
MAANQQAQLDALAQHLGYPNYSTYVAYQQKQAMMRERANRIGQGTVGQVPGQPQAPPTNAPPQNWLQRLLWGLGGGH